MRLKGCFKRLLLFSSSLGGAWASATGNNDPLFTLDYQKNVTLFKELSQPENVPIRDELKKA